MLNTKKDNRRAGQLSQGQKIVRIDLPLFYRRQQLTATEAEVISFIPRGAERKIKLDTLAQLVHMRPRTVQDNILAAKKKGVPVLSSCKKANSGYYIATTEEERQRGIASLRHRSKEMMAGVEGVASADLDSWESTTGYKEMINCES